MILKQLRLRGLATPFRDREAAIDFDSLPPGLIAFAGENGAGKTTALEASGPAILYREFPYYGEAFADHVAPGVRDAFAELTFELGSHVYRARIEADPLFGGGRGKTEAYLIRDGEPLCGPLVKDFDQRILELFPQRDVFLSSVFYAQGGVGSFWDKTKGERKELFMQLLRGEIIQKLSIRSKEEADRREAEHQGLAMGLDDLRRQVALRKETAASLKEKKRELVDAEKALEAVRVELDEIEIAHREVSMQLPAAEERLAAIEREEARIQQVRAEATAVLEDGAVRAAELREEIERAKDAAGATARLEEMRRGVEDLRAKERALRDDLHDAERDLVQKKADLETLRVRYVDLAQQKSRAEEVTQARQVAAEARAKLVPWREKLAAAQTDAAATREVLEGTLAAAEKEREVERLHAAAADKGKELKARVERLEAAAAKLCDVCPMTAELREAKSELEQARAAYKALPPKCTASRDAVQAKRDDVASAEKAVEDARVAIEFLERELAKAEAVAANAGDPAVITAELEENVLAGQRTRAAAEEVEARVMALRTEISEALERQIAKIEAERPTVEQQARVEAHAKVAAEDLRKLDEVLASARVRLEVAATDEKKLPGRPDVEALRRRKAELDQKLLPLRQAYSDRTAIVYRAGNDVSRLEGQLAGLTDVEAKLTENEATVRFLADEISDWRVLERALGRDGVQALEIDAAGPGVTAIANELLRTCFDGRFQIAIETTSPKKTGGWKEVFDIRILDSEAGREARKGSGGEMVILDEALRLAIAIYNSQKAGYELRTLWRDESAGALSPKNADRYVKMLRRAREIGGFHQVLFIAQQPEVFRQADACVLFSKGGGVEQTAALAA